MSDETLARNPEDGVLTVVFGNQTYRGNYLRDLEVVESSFNEMLRTQPSRYVFWAKMTALARVITEKKKLELERYTGQLYTFLRREGERTGKKETEASIQAVINQDEKRTQLQDELLGVRLNLDHLTAIKEAFSQRAQMLMSLGANLREEFSGLEFGIAEREQEFVRRRQSVK